MDHAISSRSRNLGYGWSNLPVQQYNSRGDGWLGIAKPSRPDAVGGLRSVEQERSKAVRLNSGNFWDECLFVAGQRVVAIWPGRSDDAAAAGTDGWWTVDIGLLLVELREGGTVRVRTEEAG